MATLTLTRGAALVLASLALACEAANEVTKVSSFGTICDDPRIFALFTKDPSVDAARTIKFPEMTAMMAGRQKLYNEEISRLDDQIKLYEGEIAKRKGSAKADFMDDKAMRNMISTTLAGAKESGCGPEEEDYQGFLDKFKKNAPQHLTGKINLARFPALVDEIVGTEEDCITINGDLLHIAEVLSASTFKVSDSSEWVDKKAKAEKEKSDVQLKLSECQTAEKGIKAFEETMTERGGDEKAKGDEWRKIFKQLKGAKRGLRDMTKEADKLEKSLDNALEKLAGDEKAVADAKTSLEDCKKNEKELREAMFKVTTRYEEVNTNLHLFKGASKLVEELRDAVAMTTQKMWILFKESALEPLSGGGLDQSTNIGAFFQKSPQNIRTHDALKASVETLTGFCEKTGTPAFEKVTGVKDLKSLCDTGKSGTIMKGLYAAVEARQDEVKETLQRMQTWFDPLKGQPLTKDDVELRRLAGEPDGLREIMTTYSRSKFYQDYLEKWALKGDFLKRIAELKNAVDELSKEYGELFLAVKIMPGLVTKAEEARKAAQGKFNDAVAVLKISEEEKKKLEAELKEQLAQVAKMQAQVDDLTDRLAKAKEAWEAAKELLTKTYMESISLFEQGEEIAGPDATLELA